MSIKDDVKDVSDEIKDLKADTSFALEIMHDLRVDNKRLFVANVLLATALIISLVIIFLRR